MEDAFVGLRLTDFFHRSFVTEALGHMVPPAWVHGVLDHALTTTQQLSHLRDADHDALTILDVICMVKNGSTSVDVNHIVFRLVAALRCAFPRARMPSPPPPPPPPPLPSPAASG